MPEKVAVWNTKISGNKYAAREECGAAYPPSHNKGRAAPPRLARYWHGGGFFTCSLCLPAQVVCLLAT